MADFLAGLGGGDSKKKVGQGEQIGSTVGGTAGTLVGTYYGGPLGGMAGGYLGGLAGGAFGGIFDEDQPQDQGNGAFNASLITTPELFAQAGNMLPDIGIYEGRYNLARQPMYTQSQLNAEQQIAPGTFDLRSSSLAQLQKNLDRGYQLDPALIDLINTNWLQQGGASGAGASGLAQMYGKRSLLSAGINEEQRNLTNALGASQFNPGYYQPALPFGANPGLSIAGDLRGGESFNANLGFLNQVMAQNAQKEQSNQFQALLGQANQSILSANGGKGQYDLGSLFKRQPATTSGNANGLGTGVWQGQMLDTGSAIGGQQYGIGAQSDYAGLGGGAWQGSMLSY